MKQLHRKGLKHIIVDEVPDPVVTAHHALVRPIYSARNLAPSLIDVDAVLAPRSS